MRILRPLLPIALMLAALPVAAQTISFDSWREQRFSLLSSVDFTARGAVLDLRADGAASLLWSPSSTWTARVASWDWSVSASVPATDLARRGGDDRNIALYFVFLPEAEARAMQGASVTRLLRHPDVRALVYVWGGAHARGARVASPYLGAQGATIVLRPAGTGAAHESVDLAADYATAFGAAPEALVGLAVSADSDDTRSTLAAQVSGLSLR